MLRPATPLSILFFIAFCLLLLSVLSTPIIKAIPLATFEGVDFGVLGYCQGDDKCSGILVGYITDHLFSSDKDGEFTLPASARHSLSSILIVHPVAALMTLVCFGLAVASHFHAPAHSPRYLLTLLLLTFPTLLVSLLAFLVDVLLFSPHMKWGSWIVLAAMILVTVCSIVTCAMRRTLVSRKARKKRIAENAEMSGASFYNNQRAAEQLPKADSPPPLSTGNSIMPGDKMPEFATFELQQKKSDDRTPLNAPDSSIRSGSAGPGSGPSTFGDDETSRYATPGRPGGPLGPSGRGRPPPLDPYGNPIPLRHQGSNNTMGSNRSGAPSPFYGRGGRGGPPRGGYPPRGGPYGRGGPQGFRGPPPGWNGGRGGPMMGLGMGGPGPMMGRGQRGPPPPGYGYDDRPNFYGGPPPQGREDSPGPGGIYGIPRNLSPQQMGGPMPIGQAVEMDDRGGLGSNFGLRDSDADVQGMIGLQQQRLPDGLGRRDSDPRGANPISPSSNYGEEPYVPARANWNAPQGQPSIGREYSNSSGSQNSQPASRGLSPIQASPVELPAQIVRASPNPSKHKRTASSDYYEDVDPRFAEESTSLPATNAQIANEPPLPTAGLPSSTVMPSSFGPLPPRTHPTPPPGMPSLHTDPIGRIDPNSYEELADGARSPAASEASHFTSVSQRGINPQWRPPNQPNPAYTGTGYGSVRKAKQDDSILEQNPDFIVPGAGPVRGPQRPGSRGARGGMRGGTREPGLIGTGGMGRYPDAI